MHCVLLYAFWGVSAAYFTYTYSMKVGKVTLFICYVIDSLNKNNFPPSAAHLALSLIDTDGNILSDAPYPFPSPCRR